MARVRVKAGAARRCSRCRRRCPGYDTSRAPRRWRGLDLGTTQVFLQATTSRVSCREHGVVVAAVPWARPGSRFTTAFEDTAAWLVCHATLSVVAMLLRVAWRSVADIVTRVVADRAAATDRLAGLRRIGIDEISYRKGQRYLLCVVDHDTGRLVWAGKNRTQETMGRFFDDLGADRAAQLTHVSADGAQWIHDVVAVRAPKAVLCLDAFHVVAWATEALDQVRRAMVNRLRAGGHHDEATALKGSRWALLKNPPNLTGDQRATLAGIAKANGGLYRAYLLKEQLRTIFQAVETGRRPSPAGRLDRLGQTVPPRTVRQARQDHQELPETDLERRRTRPVQRPLRSHQHPPAATHPTRLRLPQPRSTDRHGRPHPRRPLPTTAWTIMKRNPQKRQEGRPVPAGLRQALPQRGADDPGTTRVTVDGMSLDKIETIITVLRHERYRWTPVRRAYIDKKGTRKKRPLGLPTWSDKLVQEVIRLILEAYYEPQFSDRSHGFRPGRGCHTALGEIYHQWHGTVWFIEGDISDCSGISRPFDHGIDPGREDSRRPVPAPDRWTAPGRISGGLARPSHPQRCAARRCGFTRPLEYLPGTGWTPTSNGLCSRPITAETDAHHFVRTCGCGAGRGSGQPCGGTGRVVGSCAGRCRPCPPGIPTIPATGGCATAVTPTTGCWASLVPGGRPRRSRMRWGGSCRRTSSWSCPRPRP